MEMADDDDAQESQGQAGDSGEAKPTPRPALVLVGVTPRAPTVAEGIFHVFTNPGHIIQTELIYRQHVDADASIERFATDAFLAHLQVMLTHCEETLPRIGEAFRRVERDAAMFDQRIRMRRIVSELRQWIMHVLLERSRVDYVDTGAWITIPDTVRALLTELSSLGEDLAHAWLEVISDPACSPFVDTPAGRIVAYDAKEGTPLVMDAAAGALAPCTANSAPSVQSASSTGAHAHAGLASSTSESTGPATFRCEILHPDAPRKTAARLHCERNGAALYAPVTVRGRTLAWLLKLVLDQPGQTHSWSDLMKVGNNARHWLHTSPAAVRRSGTRVHTALPSWAKGHWQQSMTGVCWAEQ
jgi:hypothetical protein